MYTILIVDDERPAQTFLKAICQKYCPAFDTILLSGSAAASALACTLFPTKTMFFVRFVRSVSRTESSCV